MTAPAPRAFSVGRDGVRGVRYPITGVAVDAGVVTLTLNAPGDSPLGPALSLVSDHIGVYGINDQIDGDWVVATVTGGADTTVTFLVPGATLGAGFVLGTAFITVPVHETYIRWPDSAPTGELDTVLAADDALVFHAEPWDYHTARIGFQLSPAIQTLLDNDVSAVEGDFAISTMPRLAITRSSYGFPTTRQDGMLVVDKEYSHDAVTGTLPTDAVVLLPLTDPYFGVAGPSIGMLPNAADLDYIHNYSDHPPDPGIPFKRDSSNVYTNSLYDEHLASGRWYYYTLFAYLSYEVDSVAYAAQHWVQLATTSVLLPTDFKHRDTLYSLLPPYYQALDTEFTAGRDQLGFLQKWMSTVGYDLDLTRTYAEGIQDVYNLDRTSWQQLQALGEQNFALETEGGLGSINYRSLVAVINRLYDGRGNARTVQQLAQVVSKYPTTITDGINLLLLTDDSEFSSGTGSWAVPYNDGADYLYGVGGAIGGLSYSGTDPEFTSTIDPDPNITWSTNKRGALKVVSTGAVVLSCGAGEGFFENRYHDQEVTNYVPLLNGIRCEPGVNYIFSFDMARVTAVSGDGADVIAGIQWFRGPLDPTDPSELLVSDYLDEEYSTVLYADGADQFVGSPTNPTRYHVEGRAPDTEPLVYAVPYIGFTQGTNVTRYISSCMFVQELNAAVATLSDVDLYLTLGTTEDIGPGHFVLGAG